MSFQVGPHLRPVSQNLDFPFFILFCHLKDLKNITSEGTYYCHYY